jgi:hypothetical protein
VRPPLAGAGTARHAYVDPNDPTHIFLAHEQPAAVRKSSPLRYC